MIKYNSNTISDWNYGSDNIVKVYRNNAVCYYKITGGGDTPTAQTPCYAVVDDISQYSSTEFVDVYDKATEKWYKLNNLNQYEEYGVYGSGRNITYYDGKLTIDGDYEYQYSGGSWVNVGEVSGGTASLPDVPFTVNYNAKNYDANTKTLLKTSGQLADVDAVITAGTPTVNDGYLTIASGTRATISGYQTYFNRTNSAPNLTIISKQKTDGSNCHMFANRDSNYNWMYRCYSTKLTLHGASEQGSVAVTTQPVIESVRIDSNRLAIYNNYTNNTSSTQSSFNYGSTNSGKFAMFQGYATTTGENFVGDFYWVYMSQNTLTDEQVKQVIAYNEGGGGEPEYPVYYDEIQDPPNNLSFSSMTEAEDYECPWVGMQATIDGVTYIFSGDSQSGYEWVEIISPIPSEYEELQWCTVPKVKPSTFFTVPYECQPNYIYTTEFTPIDFWTSSYYGGIAAYTNGSDDYEYFLFKLDNGWGDQFRRFLVKFQNYEWDTRNSGTVPSAFTFYENVKAKITLYLNGYTSGNGGVLTIENEGYSTYTNTRTQVISSSWQPAYGIKNLNLFSTTSSSDYCANIKFHSFKVEDNQSKLIYDYRPVKRLSDNKVGVFDVVNQQFYYPTSFTLTAGDPV